MYLQSGSIQIGNQLILFVQLLQIFEIFEPVERTKQLLLIFHNYNSTPIQVRIEMNYLDQWLLLFL
jgi:hypothetical protein